MIAKWNNGGTNEGYYKTETKTENDIENTVTTYATQEKQDIWKHIQAKSAEGWFIPSRAEWAAFAGELGVNNTANDSKNYNALGFSRYYWSSSQSKTNAVCNVDFVDFITDRTLGHLDCVRLATTF